MKGNQGSEGRPDHTSLKEVKPSANTTSGKTKAKVIAFERHAEEPSFHLPSDEILAAIHEEERVLGERAMMQNIFERIAAKHMLREEDNVNCTAMLKESIGKEDQADSATRTTLPPGLNGRTLVHIATDDADLHRLYKEQRVGLKSSKPI